MNSGIFYKGETLNMDLLLTDDGGAVLSGVSSVKLRLVSECNGGSTDTKTATYNAQTGKVTASFTGSETAVLGHRTNLEIMVTFSNSQVRIGVVRIGDCVDNQIRTTE